jgi:hypothetical protein
MKNLILLLFGFMFSLFGFSQIEEGTKWTLQKHGETIMKFEFIPSNSLTSKVKVTMNGESTICFWKRDGITLDIWEQKGNYTINKKSFYLREVSSTKFFVFGVKEYSDDYGLKPIKGNYKNLEGKGIYFIKYN